MNGCDVDEEFDGWGDPVNTVQCFFVHSFYGTARHRGGNRMISSPKRHLGTTRRGWQGERYSPGRPSIAENWENRAWSGRTEFAATAPNRGER